MDSAKYIGLDVHKESISIAVLNAPGKIVMECVILDQSEHDSGRLPLQRWNVRHRVEGTGEFPRKRGDLTPHEFEQLVRRNRNKSGNDFRAQL